MARTVLSAIVLSICLALTAFAAPAQGLPTWRLSPQGEDLEPGLAVQLTAEATEALGLLATILSIPASISCTGASLDEALLEVEGKSSGKALFTGCQALNSKTKTKLANCSPRSPGLAVGTILTNGLKGQLTTHEGATLEQLEPVAESKEFATVEMGEGCSIGEYVPVKGTVYLRDAGGEFETQAPTHTLEADPLTTLKASSQAASLDGKVKVDLGGAHAWREWSGVGN